MAEDRKLSPQEVEARIEKLVDHRVAHELPAFQAALFEKQASRDVRGTTRLLLRFGRYAVAVSVAVATSGFAICAVYFFPRGIPLSSLTSAQLAGAGLVYALLTGIAYTTGARLALKRLGTGVLELVLWSLTLLGVGSIGNLRAPPYVVGYFLAVAIVTWAYGAVVFRGLLVRIYRAEMRKAFTALVLDKNVDEKQRIDDSREVSAPRYQQLISQWMLSTVLFGAVVYPQVPAWMGGGAPRQVEVLWASPPENDEVEFLGSSSRPRCLFEQHSDSTYLYLSSVAPFADGRCVPPQLIFWKPPHLDKRDRRYLVLPRSRARMTLYRGGSIF